MIEPTFSEQSHIHPLPELQTTQLSRNQIEVLADQEPVVDGNASRRAADSKVALAISTRYHHHQERSRGFQPDCVQKKTINHEDTPINSMYHRVQLVKTAQLDTKRQEELRIEQELHEKEVQEYKARLLNRQG